MTRLYRLSRLAMATVVASTLAGCGGGGSSSGEGNVSRVPQPVVFITDNPIAVYSVLDDGSEPPVELSTGLDVPFPSPRVSPDHKQVLLRGLAAGDTVAQIYVRNLDGSGLVRLSNVANPAATIHSGMWQPDGSLVIYSADGDTAGVNELYRVNRDGTHHEKINEPLNPGESVHDTFWSPNGRYIAFVIRSNVGSNVAIAVHDTDLDTQVRIPVAFTFTDVKWSPTSEKLAYLRRDTDASLDPAYQLYTVNPDGTGHVLSNGSLGSANFLSEYEWSPDGQLLAQMFRLREDFAVNDYARDFINIYDLAIPLSTRVVDLAVNRTLPLIPRNLGNCFELCKFAWSEAGTELAFLSNHDSLAELEVYSYNVKDGISRELNHGFPATDDIRVLLGWTSDDRHLVYEGGVPGNTRRIAEFADPSSADPAVRISEFGNSIRTYEWSPDHDHLFATRVTGSESIVEVRHAASFDTPVEILVPNLPSSEYLLGSIHLSIDGGNVVYIAFDMMNSFIRELRSTPTSGGPARLITGDLEVQRVVAY